MCNEIKKGDLVKAWQNNPKYYVIGEFLGKVNLDQLNEVYANGDTTCFFNAIMVPKELADQLEELGV